MNQEAAKIGRRDLMKLTAGLSITGGLVASSGSIAGVASAGNEEPLVVYRETADGPFGGDYTDGGHVYALDATTGDERWVRRPHPDEVQKLQGLTAVDGKLFVGAERGWEAGDDDDDDGEPKDGSPLYVLDAETGSFLDAWDDGSMQPHLRGGPTVVDGSVYYGTFNGFVYARDVDTLATEWTFDIESEEDATIDGDVTPNASMPVQVVDETAYAADRSMADGFGKLYALDAETGDEQWSYDYGDGYGNKSGPLVYDGLVYATITGGHQIGALVALDPDDGSVVWEHPEDIPLDPPIAVDGLLYGVDRNTGDQDTQRVFAFDAETGNLEWKYESESARVMTIHNGVVYCITGKAPLTGLDAKTGDVLWTRDTTRIETEFDEIEHLNGYSSVTIHDETVFASRSDEDKDRAYALALNAWDGRPEWVYVADGDDQIAPAAPIVVNDSEDGRSVDSQSRLGHGGHHDDWEGADVLTAVLKADPWIPTVDEPVTFDASDSFTPADSIVEYAWDFGGTTDAGESVEYIFDDWGEQSVTLTVTDSDGNEHARTVTVEVQLPPIGVFDDPPRDLNGDGLFRDINGDWQLDVADVRTLQQNLDSPAVQNYAPAFNFSGGTPEEVTDADLEALYEQITGGESA